MLQRSVPVLSRNRCSNQCELLHSVFFTLLVGLIITVSSVFVTHFNTSDSFLSSVLSTMDAEPIDNDCLVKQEKALIVNWLMDGRKHAYFCNAPHTEVSAARGDSDDEMSELSFEMHDVGNSQAD